MDFGPAAPPPGRARPGPNLPLTLAAAGAPAAPAAAGPSSAAPAFGARGARPPAQARACACAPHVNHNGAVAPYFGGVPPLCCGLGAAEPRVAPAGCPPRAAQTREGLRPLAAAAPANEAALPPRWHPHRAPCSPWRVGHLRGHLGALGLSPPSAAPAVEPWRPRQGPRPRTSARGGRLGAPWGLVTRQPRRGALAGPRDTPRAAPAAPASTTKWRLWRG